MSSTLHMEVPTATSTQQTLNTVYEDLVLKQGQLNTAVNAMLAEWQGGSATQFDGEFKAWAGKMNSVTEELGSLSARLLEEIRQWESMASGMG